MKDPKLRCPQCNEGWRGKSCKVCGYARPEATKAPPKPPKTESQTVREYANTIISKQSRRDHVGDKFEDLKMKKATNKQMWRDQDFFFSVVFQSRDQKYEFLEALGKMFNIDVNYYGQNTLQVVNGLKLAKSMEIPLENELVYDYPCGNIEVHGFILDEEVIP